VAYFDHDSPRYNRFVHHRVVTQKNRPDAGEPTRLALPHRISAREESHRPAGLSLGGRRWSGWRHPALGAPAWRRPGRTRARPFCQTESGRDGPLPQVLEPQQHDEHSFELAVEMDLVDHLPFVGDNTDEIADAIEEFLTGSRPPVAVDRVLATVLWRALY
jgi:hypothetical protein